MKNLLHPLLPKRVRQPKPNHFLSKSMVFCRVSHDRSTQERREGYLRKSLRAATLSDQGGDSRGTSCLNKGMSFDRMWEISWIFLPLTSAIRIEALARHSAQPWLSKPNCASAFSSIFPNISTISPQSGFDPTVLSVASGKAPNPYGLLAWRKIMS